MIKTQCAFATYDYGGNKYRCRKTATVWNLGYPLCKAHAQLIEAHIRERLLRDKKIDAAKEQKP